MAITEPLRDQADGEYLVECFWPGVSIADVDELDRRVRRVAQGSRRRGVPVRYLGSLLVPGDEVVLFEFQAGSAQIVAATSARAGLPFQRVVRAMRPAQEVNP
jgi:hypothetical protein